MGTRPTKTQRAKLIPQDLRKQIAGLNPDVLLAIHDLREGLYRLRQGFERHRLTPAVVDLSCWEDGYRLLSMIDREHTLYVEMGRKDPRSEPVNQVTINGVIVRWPAPRRALPSGGFETAWHPTPDELARLAAGAPVYLRVIGSAHPPVSMEVGPTPEDASDVR